MSKIGKQPIQLMPKVTVTIDGNHVVVAGPLGTLAYDKPESLDVKVVDGKLLVTPAQTGEGVAALWGLWRSLLANAVQGVSEGFKIQLELVGVGYRVQKSGEGIELEVGFSHKVPFVATDGVTLEVEKGVITVKGYDKQAVGQVAANIRRVRKPEPYKGKGIRYVGEVVKLKPGKAAKAGGVK